MSVYFVNQCQLLSNLKKQGFYPKTIFDVGVAKGTPWLYEAFPDSYYYLFEPVHTFDKDICKILEDINGIHVKKALSSRAGFAKLFIPRLTSQHQISTFHYSLDGSREDDLFEIEVITLDGFCKDHEVLFPCLLKTDVQGHDLDVLKGARHTLSKFDFVISEIPIYGPWGGGAEFFDYIRFMHENGFIVYDFVEPLRRPYDNRLHSIDICFVNISSPLGRRGLYTDGERDAKHALTHYALVRGFASGSDDHA